MFMKRPITRLELAIVLVLLIVAGAYAIQVNAFYDFIEIGAPSNPGSNNDRLYADSTSHSLTCLTSTGGSCLSVGGGATLTQLLGDSTLTAPTTGTFGTSATSPQATGVSFTNDSSGGFSGVILTGSSSANDTNIVARLMAVPATPWSFRMRSWQNGISNRYAFGGGICLYDGTKLIMYGSFGRSSNVGDGIGLELRVGQFNTTSSFSGSPMENIWFGFPGRLGLFDIKLVDDGTNRIYYGIGDGVAANQVKYYTETDTNFLTATHVGICIAPGHNTAPTGAALIEWMKVIDWTQGTS